MNALIQSIVVGMAKDMVIDIVSDMISPKSVGEVKEKAVGLLNEWAAETETTLDDKAVAYLVEHVLTNDNFNRYGKSLIEWCIEHAQSSATKYDDYVIPILEKLLEIFSAPIAA